MKIQSLLIFSAFSVISTFGRVLPRDNPDQFLEDVHIVESPSTSMSTPAGGQAEKNTVTTAAVKPLPRSVSLSMLFGPVIVHDALLKKYGSEDAAEAALNAAGTDDPTSEALQNIIVGALVSSLSHGIPPAVSRRDATAMSLLPRDNPEQFLEETPKTEVAPSSEPPSTGGLGAIIAASTVALETLPHNATFVELLGSVMVQDALMKKYGSEEGIEVALAALGTDDPNSPAVQNFISSALAGSTPNGASAAA